jgi:hypothetical protein
MTNPEFSPQVPLRPHLDLEYSQVVGEDNLQDVLSAESVAPLNVDTEKKGAISQFFNKYKARLAIGATATSVAATLVTNPFEETKHQLIETAPWVGTSLIVGEAMWLGGAAIAAASLGDKIGNPIKVKEKFNAIADRANSSRLFKTGFWINTIGAIGEVTVPSVGIIANLPPQSWGVISIGLLDLGITVSVRKAIRAGIRENRTQQSSTQTNN